MELTLKTDASSPSDMNPGTVQTDIADERDAFNGRVVRDPIDESGRAVQLLAGQNRLLESIAKGCPLSETLRGLCLFVEQFCRNSVCGVLLVGPTGDRVEHGAGPSLPPSYNEAIHGRTISVDAGPCGMAIFLNKQVIADDIASDNRWIPEWRSLALGNGLRACWSTPIHSSDKRVLGTFAIYWREPRRPTDEDQKAINQVTHLAAVAIERERTELSLRQSEERFRRMAESLQNSEAKLEEAQRITHVGYWERDLDTELLTWSNETYRIFGLSPQERVLHLSQLAEMIHLEDRHIVLAAVAEALRGGPRYNVEYRVIRPGGEVRFVHSMGEVVRDHSGRPHRMFGTVQDITERKQAAEALRLSQQSRQVAVEAERNRLARDIHDTLAQGFTGVIVQLEAAADASSKGLAKEMEDHLRRAADLAREGLGEARRSARAIRPQALQDSTLCNALEDLIRKVTEGTTMRGNFSVQGEPRTLPADWDENLLRIGQEILTNALRHAQATEFKARLFFIPTEIRLELQDNGRGFDPTSKCDGLGLIGIKERVESLGGQFTVQSENGRGTTALVVVPLPNRLSPAET
jgi:PAS domain S-box-containing protein